MSLCLVIRPAILGAIGLLDRLSRNLAFIATLMDSGTKFVAVGNPHAHRLTLHIFAAVAHHELRYPLQCFPRETFLSD